MRIGVVGLGYWGSKHVRVLSSLEGVSRVVGIDQRVERRREMAAAFPALITRASLADALDDVDALVIATHPSTHAVLGLEALAAGKHVMVEKPLATTAADAARLVAAAQDAGRTLMVGHTFAYNPAVTAMRDLVRSGGLGSVLHLSSDRLNLGIFQSDCDVIWDLAPHDITITNTVLGATPTAVTAWGSGHVDPRVVDNAYLRLDYGTLDTQAVLHVSWLDPHKVRKLTVVGSERMAVYDDMADDERLRIYDKGVRPEQQVADHDKPMSYRYGDISSPYIPFREPLLLEDQHFLDCISTGATPLTDGLAGLAVVEVLEAASRSLATGRTVPLVPSAAVLAGRTAPAVPVIQGVLP